MAAKRTEFINTCEIYQRILDAPTQEVRTKLYIDLLVTPWNPMMEMMTPKTDDPLAGAKAWAWLLPDQTETMQSLLERLEAADAWRIGSEALQQAVASFDAYAERIPFDTITGWLVLGDPSKANPYERGYTGATDWQQPRLIGQFWDPNEYNLPRLPGLIAHEMHHLICLKAFPWSPGTSVADYIIIEGTAEAFAASLFGEEIVGFYVTDIDESGIEKARKLIEAGLNATGFDVIRGYIFGDELAEKWRFRPVGGMPTYGGYATGYRVVQAFLKQSGVSIEEATFLPAQEIIAGSGYFD